MLHATLDGELDAAGAIEMERAIATDPKLRAEYARLEALHRVIHEHAPREHAPKALRARVLALTVDDKTSSPVVALKRPRFERPTWPAFAATIAATIVVTLGLQSSLFSTSNALDEAALAVVAGHMRGQISGQSVDVASSDRHTVKPWLARKLPMATIVIDLGAEGFELLGGRVDIVAGSPAPTLVYKRHQHLISLTEISRNAADYPLTPRQQTTEGYPVVIWKDGSRGYIAVSDIAPAELNAFVEAFRKAAAKEEQGEAEYRR